MRALLAVVVGLVLAAVGWGIALVDGVFVTGAVSAALTWLWFGIVMTFLLSWGAALRRDAVDSS